MTPKEIEAAAELRRKRVVKAAVEEGKSTREIAKEEGVDHSTIVRDLQKASDSSGAGAPDESEAERKKRRERAKAAAEDGMTTREIAKDEGVSQMTVVRDLQKASDSSETPVSDESEAKLEERRERVKEKKDAGMTTRQIAQEEGVDQATVARDLKKTAEEEAEDATRTDGGNEADGHRATTARPQALHAGEAGGDAGGCPHNY